MAQGKQADSQHTKRQQGGEMIRQCPSDHYSPVCIDKMCHWIETIERLIARWNELDIIENWRQVEPKVQQHTQQVLCVPELDMKSGHQVCQAESNEELERYD